MHDDEDAILGLVLERGAQACMLAINDVVLKLVLAFEIVLHQLGGGTGVQLLPGCRNRVRVRISKNMVSRSRVRGGVKGRVGRWQARQGRGWVEMREAYIRIRLSYLTH